MTSLLPLPPGSVIGILGGGQLGRMTAQAAQRLGYRAHILTPEPDAPASQVTDRTTLGAYDDPAALDAFVRAVDVITYEFENIPPEPVAWLAERKPVRPGPRVLKVTQDRLREKDFLSRLEIPTTRWRTVPSFPHFAGALADIGTPAVLKSARMGYDGKGQAMIGPDSDLGAAFRKIGSTEAILEAFVDFSYEASVIVARGVDGVTACFPPVENRHVNHILAETRVPAPMRPEVAAEAVAIAEKIANALELVGLICVELFVTDAGKLMVNELAPRPHNSGHWTLDACVTNQFEQLVRAVAGLPLGSTERLADAVMENLIGGQPEAWQAALADPRAKLHLYGKAESRDGRKMGHVTRLYPRPHQS